jgi:hypothetical protein
MIFVQMQWLPGTVRQLDYDELCSKRSLNAENLLSQSCCWLPEFSNHYAGLTWLTISSAAAHRWTGER